MALDFRIGHGFDVHRFKRGRKLILGGVEIPYSLGLAGHSDADVVLHALINALLGAMGKGDIGAHFPDTDLRYKGISSARLLEQVLKMMRRDKFRLVNGDITVIAEKPRLAPFAKKIREKLAALLRVRVSQINFKATTTEGLGWIGQGKGMAATAVVLLAKTRRR
ncbi:MAG: 2-C-methyl-D-erythritol 2,4-cyclodiphosphate synthase [Deltaproteobacteria bacterium]|nr:2-C-methyl-D-erythritol 2,4-cyclodiphosphate synthase [Deltaproteobacteria bacterium]MBI2349664.1 2-C-methyl-D-erythritol 2,4-cyclodiphosphate synthase [Deltaproteobacteria bacterium]